MKSNFCHNPICEYCEFIGAPPRCQKSSLNENDRYQLIQNMKSCPDKERIELKLNQKKKELKRLENRCLKLKQDISTFQTELS